jgi:hypothetical protein
LGVIFFGGMAMKPVQKDSLLYTRLWEALHGTDMDEPFRVELLEQFPHWKTGPDSKTIPHDDKRPFEASVDSTYSIMVTHQHLPV